MSHRILIADDEPNILISLEYLMKREGYSVSVARDGQEAIDAVLRDPRHPARLLPAYDSGDHLHPGDAGYQVVADAVKLPTLGIK